MPRPKGSKNKTNNQKIIDIIAEVKDLSAEDKEKLEAIDELEDLLDSKPKPKVGRLVGYHPITGEEVWI